MAPRSIRIGDRIDRHDGYLMLYLGTQGKPVVYARLGSHDFQLTSPFGVALNTWGMPESAARSAVRRAAHETGLPAIDPVRFGVAPLIEAVRACQGRRRATLG